MTERPNSAPKVQISVVTASFEALEKLPTTMATVASQRKALWEHVIIDGASSDGTHDLLRTIARINLQWTSEPDAGVYDAMNKGIARARGQFLLFLGAGDRLLPDALQKVSAFIEKLPAAKPRMVYGDVLDQSGYPFTAGRFSKSRIARMNICHQGIFYERSIFELLGKYELRYPIMADWAFNLRCFGDRRIAKLHFPEAVAEFEGGGLCATTPDVAFAQDRLRLIRERLGLLQAFRFRAGEAIRRRWPKS